MEPRIKTGIEGFDNLLGGGFIPHSMNLLTGCSGCGKTLFTLYYLYHGAVKEDQSCVYITLEEMKDHLVRDAKTIGMDLDSVPEEKLKIFDLSSLRLNTLTTLDERDSPDSPLRLTNLIDLIRLNYKGVVRMGIDSIIPIAISYRDENEFRSELFRFMFSLKEMGITTVFTTEIAYSSDDTSRFGMEDFLADSVTLFRMREEWGRQMKVHKMRGSNHIKNFVDYDISSDGLKVLYK